MSAMDRKAELERKKARLAAMKEERKRKEEEKKKKEPGDSLTPGSKTPDLRQETEEMLKNLGIPEASPVMAAAAAQQASSGGSAPPVMSMTGGATAAPPQLRPVKRMIELSTSKVTQTSIPPRENVSYSKETQTQAEQFEREDDDTDSLDVAVHTPPPTMGGGAGATPHTVHKMPHAEMMKPAETVEDTVKEDKPPPVKELSDVEKDKILSSEDYMRFMDKSSKIIERMLYEKSDFFLDYAKDGDEDKESKLAEGEKVKLNRQFFDERWSKHRTVTCLDWSAQYPELLVASYNNNEESPHDPDGVALIWNIKYKKTTPEYIFHCQSAVMSSCFAKFHPNLVVGGTYSGQIVLWDNRSNKRTPVQRTPLSAAAHTHPVYCVQVVGTQNAHNLISVSTDGKICSWSLDMLSNPQDSMELQHKQSKAVAVSSMSFFSNDVNNYVVGSEEGAVYTACRHGTKAGISEMFEGHQGPVTGIHTNNVPGQIDFSPYFLSSSFDWTVKLWNAKDTRPLHSFEDNADYIYDVKWSPIHPALFSTVDGMGRLDIWNLNNDIEVPTATTYVENNIALNKCLWHQSGRHIAAGDDVGKIHIYDVGENLANPRSDEWTRFLQTLAEMKQNQTEREEERNLTFMTSPLR